MSPEGPNIQQQIRLPNLNDPRLLLRAIIGGIIVLGIVIIFILKNSDLLNPPKAVLGDKTFTVAVADDSQEQMKGLSGKDSLSKDRGMVFVFEKPDNYSFWMKGMKFPIDIIFIKDDKIVKIYEDVKPPKENEGLPIYQTPRPADKVLEIRGGLSKEYKFKEGQSVEFKNI